MTIMGIAANKRAIDITGTTVHVKKIMVNEPIRRIGALEISIALPKQNYSDGDMAAFHHAAKTCPVMMSIHPEIDVKYNLSVVE
jgi:uncharacterized OsmC-like protein